MADSTIANSLAETSVTGGNDDDPVDVLWRNVQHLLCQAEKDRQTIQMYQGECDKLEDKCINMETIRKMTQHKLEVAWRRHYSDRAKIQELRRELEVQRAEKPLKMKSQEERRALGYQALECTSNLWLERRRRPPKRRRASSALRAGGDTRRCYTVDRAMEFDVAFLHPPPPPPKPGGSASYACIYIVPTRWPWRSLTNRV